MDAEDKLWDRLFSEVSALAEKMEAGFVRADQRGRERATVLHDKVDDLSERVGRLEVEQAKHNHNGNGTDNGGRRFFHMPELSTNQKLMIVVAIAVKLLVGVNIAQFTGAI